MSKTVQAFLLILVSIVLLSSVFYYMHGRFDFLGFSGKEQTGAQADESYYEDIYIDNIDTAVHRTKNKNNNEVKNLNPF